MPPSTVTVCALVSSETTLFISLVQSRSSLLSAMVLKQCRVPSAFSLGSFFTSACTSSTVLGYCTLSVLYVRLPAQFFRRCRCDQPLRGDIIGVAIKVALNCMKVFLFIVHQVESMGHFKYQNFYTFSSQ